LVNLPVITDYREGDAVWADFKEVRPGILGALYTAVAAGLRSIVAGEEITAKLPRMAGFAKWSIRVETALGLGRGEFLEAFGGSRDEGAATVLEAEPISYRVYEYARSFSAGSPWEGTAKQLLDILNECETDDTVKRSAGWPKAANKLSGLLGRIAPALAKQGVIWKRAGGSNKRGRVYNLYYVPPTNKGDGGDDRSSEGDGTSLAIVPQESAIDKPNSNGGTIGDGGDDRFSHPADDEDEGEV